MSWRQHYDAQITVGIMLEESESTAPDPYCPLPLGCCSDKCEEHIIKEFTELQLDGFRCEYHKLTSREEKHQWILGLCPHPNPNPDLAGMFTPPPPLAIVFIETLTAGFLPVSFTCPSYVQLDLI